MEEEFENNIPFDLISKVIEGEASVEEIAQIDVWRKQSEENEKEFQNLAQIMGEVPATVPEFDVNKAWNKVENKIEQEKVSSAPKSWMKLAAVACVALVIGMFLWPSSVKKTRFVAQNDGEIFLLPDSSKLTLKKGASVEYKEDFGTEVRNISFKGEGFFNIKRDTTKQFKINLGEHSVSVLGTSFNISESSDSIKVIVATGKVLFAKNSKPNVKVQKFILEKGDAIKFDAKTNSISEPAYINPSALFYATKTIVFKKTKMKEVVKVLSAVYSQDIQIGCEALANESFNGQFKNETFDEAVTILSVAMDAEVEETDGKLILTQDVCN